MESESGSDVELRLYNVHVEDEDHVTSTNHVIKTKHVVQTYHVTSKNNKGKCVQNHMARTSECKVLHKPRPVKTTQNPNGSLKSLKQNDYTPKTKPKKLPKFNSDSRLTVKHKDVHGSKPNPTVEHNYKRRALEKVKLMKRK